MLNTNPPKPQDLTVSRRHWVLWGVTILVVLALTAAIPFIYLPLVRLIRGEGHESGALREAYSFMVGLTGLVLIFCLYMTLKQQELARMRAALEEQEREKEAVRIRLSELSELFHVSAALNVQLDLDSILQVIVRRVVYALRAQQASIMIYNPEKGLLETRASYGLESEWTVNARKRLGEGIAGWVAQQKESVQLDGNIGHNRFGQYLKTNRHITSALSLPLLTNGRCVGVLNVNRINHPETFQAYHGEILELFGNHVGAVIERAEIISRLGSRTSQLEADNRKLAELNHMKDVFLTTASHELKTPLTSVIAYAELLDLDEPKASAEQRNEFVKRLRSEADRLLVLIEEILDLSRIESGKLVLHPGPVSPNDLARSAMQTAHALSERSGVEISADCNPDLPDLQVDEVKMRQVLVNLLVNAIKFSPRGGRVMIRTIPERDFVRIEVADQGPGITPEDATHIFELFGQGMNNKERRGGGLGIGLHLVKRITELHGGRVSVDSRPGVGSTFILRLPLTLAQISGEAPPAEQAA